MGGFSYCWWKDIWIPLAGAVIIPVFIYLFSSVRADKKKNVEALRDSLNFLISISFASIYKLIVLKNTLNHIHLLEKKALKGISEQEERELFISYSPLTEFEVIQFEKYSHCISFKPDFILNLIEIKSALEVINFRMLNRNKELEKIAHCENSRIQSEMFDSLIKLEVKKYDEYIEKIDITILLLKAVISDIKDLEKFISGLNLRDTEYTAEYQEIFANLEKIRIKKNDE